MVGELGNFLEDGFEEVGVVVGGGVGEGGEVFGGGEDAGDAFESHTGIDVFMGEGFEGAVGFGVELDEDEVPDFDAVGGAGIDEFALGIAFFCEVDVDFAAGTAGSGIAHHPEVIFFVTVDDMDIRVEACFFEEGGPDVVGFLVEFIGVAWFGVIDGDVEAVFWEFPDVSEEVPGPFDGIFFEVVAEGPVTEHFEEGVVVGIEADVFEVVVFTAGADAFLGIGGCGVGGWAFVEEVGDELVHAGVGEEEVGGAGEEGFGGDEGVSAVFEVVDEGVTDF